MTQCIISVIIVVRNEAKYIINCIKSIELQFYNNYDEWELIIVDGLSEDDTIERAKIYLQQSQINYKIIINKNKNLASGWNLGIQMQPEYMFVDQMLIQHYMKIILIRESPY